MTAFEEYYNFMEKYIGFYREVKDSEHEKLEALLSNDLDRIDKALNVYQLQMIKAQQMEYQRISMCENLGFENMAFSSIVSNFEGEEKLKLIAQKNTLNDILTTIKYMNKKSIEFANMQIGYVDGESQTYDSKGRPDSRFANSNLLNKQI